MWLEQHEQGKDQQKMSIKDHKGLADMVRDLDFILNVTGRHSSVLSKEIAWSLWLEDYTEGGQE